MRILLFILCCSLLSCSQDDLAGKYQSHWSETHYVLELKKDRFRYTVEGHRGNMKFQGSYEVRSDTLLLNSEQLNDLPQKFRILNAKCLVDLDSGFDFCKRKGEGWETKHYPVVSNKPDTFRIDAVRDFPKIKLSDILSFYETSGAVGKVPSSTFYNPANKGLFVFYTLFDRSKGALAIPKALGSLITHTYYKESYGWGAEDKDQTFIELNLRSAGIRIGENIQVNNTIDEIIPELGIPLLQNDTLGIFVGSDNSICQVRLQNDVVKFIRYGVYNIDLENEKDPKAILRKVEELFKED